MDPITGDKKTAQSGLGIHSGKIENRLFTRIGPVVDSLVGFAAFIQSSTYVNITAEIIGPAAEIKYIARVSDLLSLIDGGKGAFKCTGIAVCPVGCDIINVTIDLEILILILISVGKLTGNQHKIHQHQA